MPPQEPTYNVAGLQKKSSSNGSGFNVSGLKKKEEKERQILGPYYGDQEPPEAQKVPQVQEETPPAEVDPFAQVQETLRVRRKVLSGSGTAQDPLIYEKDLPPSDKSEGRINVQNLPLTSDIKKAEMGVAAQKEKVGKEAVAKEFFQSLEKSKTFYADYFSSHLDANADSYVQARNQKLTDAEKVFDSNPSSFTQDLDAKYEQLAKTDPGLQVLQENINQEIQRAQQLIASQYNLQDPAQAQKANEAFKNAQATIQKKYSLQWQQQFSAKYGNQWEEDYQSRKQQVIDETLKPSKTFLGEEYVGKVRQALTSEYFNQRSHDDKKQLVDLIWKSKSAELMRKGITGAALEQSRRDFYYHVLPVLLLTPHGNASAFSLKRYAEQTIPEVRSRLADINSKLDAYRTDRGGIIQTPESKELFDQAEMLGEARDNLEDILKHPEKNRGSMAQGILSNRVADMVPFIHGVADLPKNINLLTIGNKVKNGQPLTAEEDFLLKSETYQKDFMSQSPASYWYDIGKMTGNMFPYVGEFIATGGMYTATKQAVAKGLEKAAQKFGATILDAGAMSAAQSVSIHGTGAAVPLIFSKNAAGLAAEGLAALVGTLSQTALNPQMYVNTMLQRMQPGMVVAFSPEGDRLMYQLDLTQRGKNENPGTAFLKGFGMTWAEFATERVGEIIPWAGSYLAKNVIGNEDFFKRLTLGYWLAKRGVKVPNEGLQNLLKHNMSWNGMIGENFEEWVNQPLSNIISGDASMFAGMDKRFFVTLAGSIGAFGALSGVTGFVPNNMTVNYADPNGTMIPVKLNRSVLGQLMQLRNAGYFEIEAFRKNKLPTLTEAGDQRIYANQLLNAFALNALENKLDVPGNGLSGREVEERVKAYLEKIDKGTADILIKDFESGIMQAAGALAPAEEEAAPVTGGEPEEGPKPVELDEETTTLITEVLTQPATIDVEVKNLIEELGTKPGSSLSQEGDTEFIMHEGNEYEVTKDKDGWLQFESSVSGEPITRKSKHYDDVVSKYIVEKYANAPLTASMADTQEGYAMDVAQTSVNPMEILMTAIGTDEMEGEGAMSAKDQYIYENKIQFNAEDLKREFGMTLSNLGNWEAIRKNYYSPNGKSIDQSLIDMQGAGVNGEEYGENLTHEDLWDYIQRYPYGFDINNSFGRVTRSLADRFEAITGIPFDRKMMQAFKKAWDAARRIPEADQQTIITAVTNNPEITSVEVISENTLSPETKEVLDETEKWDNPWADLGGELSTAGTTTTDTGGDGTDTDSGEQSEEEKPKEPVEEVKEIPKPKPPAVTTPGTRKTWATLAEWIVAYGELFKRPPSAKRHKDLRTHIDALTDEIVEAAPINDINTLQSIIAGAEPGRGKRADHPATRIKNAIDRRRTVLEKPSKTAPPVTLPSVAVPYKKGTPQADAWLHLTEIAREGTAKEFQTAREAAKTAGFGEVVAAMTKAYIAAERADAGIPEGESLLTGSQSLYDAIRKRQLGEELFTEEKPAQEQTLEQIATVQGWENWLDMPRDQIKKYIADHAERLKKPEYSAFAAFLRRLASTEVAPAPVPKTEMDSALDELLGAWDDITKAPPGIIHDPLREAEKDLKLLSAAMKLLRVAVKQGLFKFADIVEFVRSKIGEKVKDILPVLKRAYTSLHTDTELTDEQLDKLDDVKTVRNFELTDVNKDSTISAPAGGSTSELDEAARPPETDTTITETPVEELPQSKDVTSGGINQGSLGFGDGTRPGGGSGNEEYNGPGSGGTGGKTITSIDLGEDTGHAPTVTKEENLNHQISPDDVIVPAGEVSKIRANFAAIKLANQLVKEERQATSEEKVILAQFTGWGALAQVLDTQKAAQQGRTSWKDRYLQYHQELKELLTQSEWNAATSSTINAHYTSRNIINSMWDIARLLGFTGGNVLESSAGVGHFMGLMPPDMANASNWIAVELDTMTGKILKLLYPQSNVFVKGFEDVNVAPASIDLAITNVPFARVAPLDHLHSDLSKFSMHNYFIAKNMRAVRPGGIGIFITTTSTMDNPGTSGVFREYMNGDGQSDLIASIRLPNTAFEENAGTSVTTDIVILRKRDGNKPSEFAQQWVNVLPILATKTKEGENIDIMVNEYFARNPGMMLGRMRLAYQGKKGATIPQPNAQVMDPLPDADVQADLRAAIANIPKNVMGDGWQHQEQREVTAAQQGQRENTFVEKDGVMYLVQGGELVKVGYQDNKVTVKGREVTVKHAIKMFISVKQKMRDLIGAELNSEMTDEQVEESRRALVRVYNDFVTRFGNFNRNRAIDFLRDDDEHHQVYSLERIEAKYKKDKAGRIRTDYYIERAPMLQRRVNRPYTEPKKADTWSDAYQISNTYRNGIDLAYIGQLMGGINLEEVKKGLLAHNLVYEDPKTGLLVNPEEYLSGFVRVKLKDAQAAVLTNQKYRRNVADLEKVIPKDVPFILIGVELGAEWIPAPVYDDFAKHLFGVESAFIYSTALNKYVLQSLAKRDAPGNTDVWGVSSYVRGVDLMMHVMNLTTPNLTMPNPDPTKKSRVKDKEAIERAMDKMDQIRNEFINWIRDNKQYHENLGRRFNDDFNGYVEQKYTKIQDRFPGMAEYLDVGDKDIFTMREHQGRAVLRGLSQSILLAHAIGSGKTFTLITLAMEMRRLGIARKPMIVADNPTVEQFATSFRKLYPWANILVPNERQMDSDHRQRLVNMIATGEYDAIVIPRSFLKLIPNNPDREEAYKRERIEALLTQQKELDPREDQVEYGIIQDQIEKMEKQFQKEKAKTKKVKDVARTQLAVEKKVKKVLSMRKDATLTFEELGVDALFLDEAHNYKKLGFDTAMAKVRGIDVGASAQALDAYLKAKWIQQNNNGRNVILASGTPITNTVAEIWTMLRMVDPEILNQYNIKTFDQFARLYARKDETLEPTPVGTFKKISRLKSYINTPSLIKAFRMHSDVVRNEDIPEYQKDNQLPKLATGKAEPFLIEMSPQLEKIMNGLKDWYLSWEALTGKEKFRNRHVPLLIYGLAKKAAIDLRLLNTAKTKYPDDPKSKVNQVLKKVKELYDEETPRKGVQLLFCDSIEARDGFNLHEDMRNKLIAAGIPADEIVIMTENIKGARREKLFADAKEGKVRILIGHRSRLGIGVNVQDRVYAVWNIDAPDRPDQYDQGVGRGVRQGNLYGIPVERGGFDKPIHVFDCGVSKTLDANAYGRLALKAKFIQQILAGEIETWEDIDDPTEELTAADLQHGAMAAILSGSQLAMKLSVAQMSYRKFQTRKANHERKLVDLNDRFKENRTRIRVLGGERQPAFKKLIDLVKPGLNDEGNLRSVTIGGKVITDKVATAIEDLMETMIKQVNNEDKLNDPKRSVKFSLGGIPIKVIAGKELVQKWVDEEGSLFGGRGGQGSTRKKTMEIETQVSTEVDWDSIDKNLPWSMYMGNMSALGLLNSIDSKIEEARREIKEIPDRVARYKEENESIEKDLDVPYPDEAKLTAIHSELIDIELALEAESKAMEQEMKNKKKANVEEMKDVEIEEADEEAGEETEEDDDIPPAGGGGRRGGIGPEYRWEQKLDAAENWILNRKFLGGRLFGSEPGIQQAGAPTDQIIKMAFKVLKVSIRAGFSVARAIRNAVNYIKSTRWFRDQERAGTPYNPDDFVALLRSQGIDSVDDGTLSIDRYMNRLRKFVTRAPKSGEVENIVDNLTRLITQRVKEIGGSDTKLFLAAIDDIRKSLGNPARLATAIKNFEQDVDAYHLRFAFRTAQQMKIQARRNLGKLQKFPDIRLVAMELVRMPLSITDENNHRNRMPEELLYLFIKAIEPLSAKGKELLPNMAEIVHALNLIREWRDSIEPAEQKEREVSEAAEERKRQQMEEWAEAIDGMKARFDIRSIIRPQEVQEGIHERINEFTAINHRQLEYAQMKNYYGIMYNLLENQAISPNMYNDFVMPVRQKKKNDSVIAVPRETQDYIDNWKKIQGQLIANPKVLWDRKLLRPDPSLKYDAPIWNHYIQELTRNIEKIRTRFAELKLVLDRAYKMLGRNVNERDHKFLIIAMYRHARQSDGERQDIDFREHLKESMDAMATSAAFRNDYTNYYLPAYNALVRDAETGLINLDATYATFTPEMKAMEAAMQKMFDEVTQPIVQDQQMYVRGENVRIIQNYHPMVVLGGVNLDPREASMEDVVNSIVNNTAMGGQVITTKAGAMFARQYPKQTFYSFRFADVLNSVEGVLFDKYLTEPVKEVFGSLRSSEFINTMTSDVAASLRETLMNMLKYEIGFNEQSKDIGQRLVDFSMQTLTRTALVSIKRFGESGANWIVAAGILFPGSPKKGIRAIGQSSAEFNKHASEWLDFMRDNGFSVYNRFSTHTEIINSPDGNMNTVILHPFMSPIKYYRQSKQATQLRYNRKNRTKFANAADNVLYLLNNNELRRVGNLMTHLSIGIGDFLTTYPIWMSAFKLYLNEHGVEFSGSHAELAALDKDMALAAGNYAEGVVDQSVGASNRGRGSQLGYSFKSEAERGDFMNYAWRQFRYYLGHLQLMQTMLVYHHFGRLIRGTPWERKQAIGSLIYMTAANMVFNVWGKLITAALFQFGDPEERKKQVKELGTLEYWGRNLAASLLQLFLIGRLPWLWKIVASAGAEKINQMFTEGVLDKPYNAFTDALSYSPRAPLPSEWVEAKELYNVFFPFLRPEQQMITSFSSAWEKVANGNPDDDDLIKYNLSRGALALLNTQIPIPFINKEVASALHHLGTDVKASEYDKVRDDQHEKEKIKNAAKQMFDSKYSIMPKKDALDEIDSLRLEEGKTGKMEETLVKLKEMVDAPKIENMTGHDKFIMGLGPSAKQAAIIEELRTSPAEAIKERLDHYRNLGVISKTIHTELKDSLYIPKVIDLVDAEGEPVLSGREKNEYRYRKREKARKEKK